ncbi:MAG TPA: hypothetical protein VFD06_02190, partial [Candidatus Polarisedimenticolia bacterium]|nr:hypothetical protein [Candidatus Polarisedimenticolia bacterium]
TARMPPSPSGTTPTTVRFPGRPVQIARPSGSNSGCASAKALVAPATKARRASRPVPKGCGRPAGGAGRPRRLG